MPSSVRNLYHSTIPKTGFIDLIYFRRILTSPNAFPRSISLYDIPDLSKISFTAAAIALPKSPSTNAFLLLHFLKLFIIAAFMAAAMAVSLGVGKKPPLQPLNPP